MSSSPECVGCGDYIHHGPVLCRSCLAEIIGHLKGVRRKVDQIDRLPFGDLDKHFDDLARDLDWAMRKLGEHAASEDA